MTASGPGSGGAQGEPDGTPSVPEHVWRLFLEDDERAIRASAPREPSARDRLSGRGPELPAGRPVGSVRPAETVGEAWRPEDTWAGPAWRELDGRARARRIGRVLGTAAAVAVALTAWSQLSGGPVAPGGGPAETIGQRLEESPALPTAASGAASGAASVADVGADSGAGSPTDPLSESLAPTESGAAGPAVFDPAPSAIPRASASSQTFG
ncbi:hypothetical protein ACIQFU_16025 [Streptomyces sp. NPDC093065]|uniref:hypothetical protein n=1 Tax=Streptomyces sp. NPDC093065 TaxID=3366021 RepID=UPI00382E96B8